MKYLVVWFFLNSCLNPGKKKKTATINLFDWLISKKFFWRCNLNNFICTFFFYRSKIIFCFPNRSLFFFVISNLTLHLYFSFNYFLSVLFFSLPSPLSPVVQWRSKIWSKSCKISCKYRGNGYLFMNDANSFFGRRSKKLNILM